MIELGPDERKTTPLEEITRQLDGAIASGDHLDDFRVSGFNPEDVSKVCQALIHSQDPSLRTTRYEEQMYELSKTEALAAAQEVIRLSERFRELTEAVNQALEEARLAGDQFRPLQEMVLGRKDFIEREPVSLPQPDAIITSPTGVVDVEAALAGLKRGAGGVKKHA